MANDNQTPNLLEVFEAWANSETVSGSEKRMNQNDRNALKREVKASLYALLLNIVGNNANVKVFENEKGIAVRLDNERLGYITVSIDPMVKDLDYDPDDEAEAFRMKQIEQAAKAAERERQKQLKMAADAELRAKKEELRKLRAEARQLGSDNNN